MRSLGWLETSMTALAHARIDVRRDRIGLHEEGLRGVNAVPANVDEAIARLRELEAKTAAFIARRRKEVEALKIKRETGAPPVDDGGGQARVEEFPPDGEVLRKDGPDSKQARLRSIAEAARGRKLFKEGKLVHRTEPEIRTHTSYLVFGVLPRGWTEEDEARCAQLNQES
jgi:tRNA (adenine57-N1/adenine58-N1)-methyltransferase catalytic subunit